MDPTLAAHTSVPPGLVSAAETGSGRSTMLWEAQMPCPTSIKKSQNERYKTQLCLSMPRGRQQKYNKILDRSEAHFEAPLVATAP